MTERTKIRPYWACWHNWRYEAYKRLDRVLLCLVRRSSPRVRMWFVVDATNTARLMYPEPDGYAGPDGLTYAHIYDGAIREKTGVCQ